MGCAASKKTVTVIPAADSSGVLREIHGPEGISGYALQRRRQEKDDEERGSSVRSSRLGNLHRYIEGEQAAAGWPPWLSAVAGEAIQGWVPLKADSFEKLDKIGQGTYSSVFRARDLDTGKIVALKKVRFDNFEPESVRFMAREIQILRRFDHPNIVKLEGLITSQLSCSIYLVFEYMEHDLAGLSSCPDIKFSESQIKCYMHQLLSGLEHCHSRGIIHRDIKGANLLVNNEGILKIADFGLANFSNPVNKQPLTSRVVTLWYRPPELLLGSTDYEATVDLWSVGCVFAEMFHGKPILQGRTEVEQLHKIFKICGSPAEEYWRKSKLPHATIFKPHHPYASCLQETFKFLPTRAFSLLETFLSVDPYKRGTAANALESEYFRTKPYACEPSSLPKYPPNKEIDAKCREESRRHRVTGRVRGSEAATRSTRTYRTSREPSVVCKLATHQESRIDTKGVNKPNGKLDPPKIDCKIRDFGDLQPVPVVSPPHEGWRSKHNSRSDILLSGPLHVTASSGFTWVKKQEEDHPSVISYGKSNVRTHSSGILDAPGILQTKNVSGLKGQANGNHVQVDNVSKTHEPYDMAKHAVRQNWTQLERPDSFDYSEVYHSQEFSKSLYMGDAVSSKYNIRGYQDQGDKVEFSGPLLSQPHKFNELLEKRERHIRQAVRRSWFQRVAGRRQGKNSPFYSKGFSSSNWDQHQPQGMPENWQSDEKSVSNIIYGYLKILLGLRAIPESEIQFSSLVSPHIIFIQKYATGNELCRVCSSISLIG